VASEAAQVAELSDAVGRVSADEQAQLEVRHATPDLAEGNACEFHTIPARDEETAQAREELVAAVFGAGERTNRILPQASRRVDANRFGDNVFEGDVDPRVHLSGITINCEGIHVVVRRANRRFLHRNVHVLAVRHIYV